MQKEIIHRLIGILSAVVPFLLTAVAFLIAATREIGLHGIYMDAGAGCSRNL